MRVTVNDDEIQVDDGTTVADLLGGMGFPDKGVAVAVNWSVLPRSRWSEPVADGARIEVLTAVQGG